MAISLGIYPIFRQTHIYIYVKWWWNGDETWINSLTSIEQWWISRQARAKKDRKLEGFPRKIKRKFSSNSKSVPTLCRRVEGCGRMWKARGETLWHILRWVTRLQNLTHPTSRQSPTSSFALQPLLDLSLSSSKFSSKCNNVHINQTCWNQPLGHHPEIEVAKCWGNTDIPHELYYSHIYQCDLLHRLEAVSSNPTQSIYLVLSHLM